MKISNEEGLRRGSSVYHRKFDKAGDKPVNKSVASNQPVVPNYEHIKNVSMKKIQLQKEIESEYQSFNGETANDEDIGFEELHFRMVRYQQRCKGLIKS